LHIDRHENGHIISLFLHTWEYKRKINKQTIFFEREPPPAIRYLAGGDFYIFDISVTNHLKKEKYFTRRR